MTDLLSLAIVGAAASLFTQIVKSTFPEGLPRAIVAIGISVLLGVLALVLNFLPGLKEALVGVVILSNIAYNIVIKHLITEK